MDLTEVLRWEKEVWELATPVSNNFMNTLICVWKSTGVLSEIQMACVSNKGKQSQGRKCSCVPEFDICV